MMPNLEFTIIKDQKEAIATAKRMASESNSNIYIKHSDFGFLIQKQEPTEKQRIWIQWYVITPKGTIRKF